jgi:hypothetical protein
MLQRLNELVAKGKTSCKSVITNPTKPTKPTKPIIITTNNNSLRLRVQHNKNIPIIKFKQNKQITTPIASPKPQRIIHPINLDIKPIGPSDIIEVPNGSIPMKEFLHDWEMKAAKVGFTGCTTFQQDATTLVQNYITQYSTVNILDPEDTHRGTSLLFLVVYKYPMWYDATLDESENNQQFADTLFLIKQLITAGVQFDVMNKWSWELPFNGMFYIGLKSAKFQAFKKLQTAANIAYREVRKTDGI